MTVIKFQSHHLSILKYLYSTRSESSDHITLDLLPKNGLIIYSKNEPVCIGFMAKIEPCFGQLDGFVTNKNLSSETRHKALSLMVDRLIGIAKKKNIKGLVCHTKDEGILKRAESIGFHVVHEKIIAKML